MGQDFLKGRKVPADMIEHAVQDQAQATAVSGGDQCVEIGIVAEPGIDTEMIDGVVSMCRRGEDRSESDAR